MKGPAGDQRGQQVTAGGRINEGRGEGSVGHGHSCGAGQACWLVDFWDTQLLVILGSQIIEQEFSSIEKKPITCQGFL